MARVRLDQEILRKIAANTGKDVQSVRKQVSRLASKRGIRSEAALLVLARQRGISIGHALRRLDRAAQEQVRDTLQAGEDSRPRIATKPADQERRVPDPVGWAIDLLLTDQELKSRCADLLRRGKYLDRAVREAATVLEERFRKLSGLGKRQERSRIGLVARAIGPDPNRAIIVVSEERSEQEGMLCLCKGLVEGFGKRLHHTLSDKISAGEAMVLCGLVNVILKLVEKGEVRRERASEANGRSSRDVSGDQ